MTLHFTTSIFRRSLSAVALLFALFGAHGSAFALTTEHATICKPYGNSNTPGLNSYVTGVFPSPQTQAMVVCPVVRTAPAPANGYSVWVDGYAGNYSTYCTLFSYNYDNTYLGSVTVQIGPNVTFHKLLTLPQSQVPALSSQGVYCALPDGAGLYDIEPVQ